MSAEIAFQLPMSQMKHFEELFSMLDQKKESLGIQTYGVSITTMEEVFLRVAHLDEDQSGKNQALAPAQV